MKEKITIVLNEREPEKAKLAERLEAELNSRGFSAGRIELTESLINRLVVRAPAVIITDYVLGDVSTGLDLLTTLNAKKSQSRVVFFTDEPSAAVALNALKNGAVDYLLMNSPNALNDLVERVSTIIGSIKVVTNSDSLETVLPDLEQVVAESEAGRRWRAGLILAGKGFSQITVLVGPKGSGRTFSAQVIQRLRGHVVAPVSMTWDFADEPINSALRYSEHLIIDAGDECSSELINELDAVDWGTIPSASLFLKTTSSESAAAITRISSQSRIIEVPSIRERLDDISGVIKLKTKELPRSKLTPLSPSNVTKILAMEWPGEFKQLTSSIIGALHLHTEGSSDFVSKLTELSKAACFDEVQPAGALSRVRALAALREGRSFRIAAMTLGCTVKQLRDIATDRNG